MERKSNSSLAVNGAAAFFSLISIIGLCLEMVKDTSISGFDVINDASGNQGGRIFLIVGLVFSIILVAAAVLNYLGIVKIAFGHFILMGIGFVILLMAVLFLIDSEIKLSDAGIGFWLYFVGAILSGLSTVGTMLYKD